MTADVYFRDSGGECGSWGCSWLGLRAGLESGRGSGLALRRGTGEVLQAIFGIAMIFCSSTPAILRAFSKD